jgi:XRE family transcriptional regulator, regulator of sulfur utilization
VIILHQGALEVFSNGTTTRVGSGSVIFNGSNQLHGLKNVGTEPTIYYVINLKTAATPAA